MTRPQSSSRKDILQESIFVRINSSDSLHLKRIFRDHQGPVVFMLHGSIENGRVFYSQNGKGLAPYLARNGFDVYVADQRGRGASAPLINRHSLYGQTETITEDIPALIRAICEQRGTCHQHWIGHSWGGVLLSSYLARFKENRPLVDSMVFFGTKRTIRTHHIEKRIKIDLVWNRISRWLIGI